MNQVVVPPTNLVGHVAHPRMEEGGGWRAKHDTSRYIASKLGGPCCPLIEGSGAGHEPGRCAANELGRPCRSPMNRVGWGGGGGGVGGAVGSKT